MKHIKLRNASGLRFTPPCNAIIVGSTIQWEGLARGGEYSVSGTKAMHMSQQPS